VRNVPLFDAPQPVERQLSQHFRDLRTERGTYARYQPARRVPCDECQAYLHENKGAGPPIGSARWSRKQPGRDMLRLCPAHKDLWVAVDG
jgi:hypothetical protein